MKTIAETFDDKVCKSWFRLLRAQRRRGKTGLTVPFMIGALRMPVGEINSDDDACFNELMGLLADMRDSEHLSGKVSIARCTELRQPVAAIYARSDRLDAVEPVPSKSRNTSLFVERRYGCDGTVESVADFLWGSLGTEIVSGCFSFENGSYQEFCEKDRKFISQALS